MRRQPPPSTNNGRGAQVTVLANAILSVQLAHGLAWYADEALTVADALLDAIVAQGYRVHWLPDPDPELPALDEATHALHHPAPARGCSVCRITTGRTP